MKTTTAAPTSRIGPAGARLPGNRALVVGGLSGGGCDSTADVFDRAGEGWTDGGAMSSARGDHAATALPDGRVLITGGLPKCSYGAAISGAEIFDPTKVGAARWTAASSMNVVRAGHAAILLKDGSVVVAGGEQVGGGSATASTEVWSGGVWTSVYPLNQSRFWFGAARLLDGRVLVAGGAGGSSGKLSSAEIYDPVKTKWTPIDPMSTPRRGPIAITMPDGRVLVAGGDDGTNNLSTTEIYDPASSTWSTTPPKMNAARSDQTLTLLARGQVLVVGGDSTGLIERFDPGAAGFVTAGIASVARERHVAIDFDDGSVLFAGGAVSGIATSAAELWTAHPVGATCTTNVDCASFSCDPGTSTCTAASDAGPPVDATADAADAADAAETALPPADTALPPADAKPSLAALAKDCQVDGDCTSGHCVEKVCCDTECKEACHSCVLPGAPGICTAEPTGVDLRGECGVALACVGTCGPAGKCIGAGAGTQCQPSECVGVAQARGPAYCSANGAPCPTDARLTFDCAPNSCDYAFGACRSGCSTGDDCAPGWNCDVTIGKCIAAPPSSSGGCVWTEGGSLSGAALPAALLALVTLGHRRRRRAPR
jgi:hypothetical protein